MIDPVDLVLGKDRGQAGIDLQEALAVMAQRLLDHDAHVRAHQPHCPQRLADGREDGRGRGQIDNQIAAGVGEHLGAQAGQLGLAGGVQMQVGDAAAEALPDSLIQRLCAGPGLELLADATHESAFGRRRARDTDNPQTRRQAGIQIEVVQRGVQLAECQIAISADNQYVADHERAFQSGY